MQGDPRWIEARFPTQCARCKGAIAKGERVFYYPNSRTLYCPKPGCGQQAAADFEAHRQDEDGY